MTEAAADTLPATPAVTPDLARLPLDRLHALADHGPDAATRAAAQRTIAARTARAAPLAATRKVMLSASQHGTPLPEVRVTTDGASHARAVRAALHELAAQVERALSATTELWHVATVTVDDHCGFVCLELWEGTAAEAARAMALLHAVAPDDGGAPRSKRQRKPRAHKVEAPAVVTEAASDGAADGVSAEDGPTPDEPAAAPVDDVPRMAEVTPLAAGHAAHQRHKHRR